MQRRGLIDREECPQDARGAYVTPTATGRAAIEAAAPAHVDTVRRLVFDQLDPDEVRTLERIASRVVDRLDAERRLP
ncbi:hypothetical protein [Micromonospora sp. KC207]|uniref:hypothetical protein n=1 Tax=Micromonospora sp. KC207 TaxID=2530377 RepID=UPI001A9F6275|nr:hypothetical protein [Micromonospora sp. KC207]